MFPPESDEPFFDFMMKKMGLTWKELKERGGYVFPTVYKKYEKSGFATPSKKVELANSLMATMGMAPLPGYREPDESPLSTPELVREYPLIITIGSRVAMYRHSEGRNIAILRDLMPHPLMSIHPATAGKLGIQEGDEVTVETPRGAMEAKAYLTRGFTRTWFSSRATGRRSRMSRPSWITNTRHPMSKAPINRGKWHRVDWMQGKTPPKYPQHSPIIQLSLHSCANNV